ncbi:hypothetical protein NQ176_g10270 [Zarea fungicola]|uniref:Uncharacterized protein n=1 Tax=Zarea fungicola TaxID=93591 RepID=A0ACC1MHH1_9HYPO|nr:hypothetical protein NQ176_g10270 [Lecanicillium fungicola]
MTPAIAYRTVRSVGFRHGGAALLRWNSSVVDVSPLKFEPPAPPIAQREKLQEEAKNKIFRDAVAADHVRHNWTRQEIAAIYYQPLLELAYQAVSGAVNFWLESQATSDASNICTTYFWSYV